MPRSLRRRTLSFPAAAAPAPDVRLGSEAAFRRVQRNVLRGFAWVGGGLLSVVLCIEMTGPWLREALDFSGPAPPDGWAIYLGLAVSLLVFLTTRALVWYLWGVIGLGLCAWLLRVSEHWSWQRSLRVVALLGIPLALLHRAAVLGLFELLRTTRIGIYPRDYDPFTPYQLVSTYLADYFAYLLVAGFSLSLAYFARYHERKQQATVLASQLAEARLQALSMQIHPHFLFNTLNAIVTLVRRQDTRTAARMLTRLGELLRASLDDTARTFVSLEDEVDFTRRYLDLEQLRLGDRLDVTWNVAPEAYAAVVPNLILQPLVENAVRHGVTARAGTSRLAIRARRTGARLVVSVEDDGPGFSTASPAAGTGIGLTNVRARLHASYSDDATLTCADAETGGAVVTLDLPFAPAASTASRHASPTTYTLDH